MSFKCPVCHQDFPFMRQFLTPTWGSFQCTACDSQLGVNAYRRFFVVPIWIGLYYFATRYIRLPASYDIVTVLGTFMVMYILYFAWFEKPRIIQRCGFRCKDCGYDLQGQKDPRCPECGRVFDETETSQMKRLLQFETVKPRKRSSVVIIVFMIVFFILTLLAVLGVRVYNAQTTSPKAPQPTPPVKTPAAP